MYPDGLCRSRVYHFFFSSRRRHTRLQGDWSSDVCSSDLDFGRAIELEPRSGIAYGHRGNAIAEKGDDRAALPDLDRAVELEPTLPASWKSRADRKSVV